MTSRQGHSELFDVSVKYHQFPDRDPIANSYLKTRKIHLSSIGLIYIIKMFVENRKCFIQIGSFQIYTHKVFLCLKGKEKKVLKNSIFIIHFSNCVLS